MYLLGMSQAKRKSQRMEEREMLLGGQRNSKRKTLVNKRNDWQKEHAGCKGKKHGGIEENKRKVILQDKK